MRPTISQAVNPSIRTEPILALGSTSKLGFGNKGCLSDKGLRFPCSSARAPCWAGSDSALVYDGFVESVRD